MNSRQALYKVYLHTHTQPLALAQVDYIRQYINKLILYSEYKIKGLRFGSIVSVYVRALAAIRHNILIMRATQSHQCQQFAFTQQYYIYYMYIHNMFRELFIHGLSVWLLSIVNVWCGVVKPLSCELCGRWVCVCVCVQINAAFACTRGFANCLAVIVASSVDDGVVLCVCVWCARACVMTTPRTSTKSRSRLCGHQTRGCARIGQSKWMTIRSSRAMSCVACFSIYVYRCRFTRVARIIASGERPDDYIYIYMYRSYSQIAKYGAYM